MYLLVLGFVNGDVDYHGPFKTKERALQYSEAAVADYGSKLARFHVADLIVSHHERFLAKQVAS